MTETAAAAWIPRGVSAAMIVGALGCGLQSAPAGAPEPAPAALTEAGVRRILSALANDSMEGRFTGSRGADRAARFIASEMKSIGLQPAGDSGYLQKVPFTTHPRRGVALLESFAAIDKNPETNRRVGYKVKGVLRNRGER
jgi:hypothetical protein